MRSRLRADPVEKLLLLSVSSLACGGLVGACAPPPPEGAGPTARAGPPARYYDWPIAVRASRKNPTRLYSNLGEYRPRDAPAWLNHGATDFVAPRNTPVFSPDVGRVRFGENSDRRAGQPPVKIGRFAFLHFNNVNDLPVNPRVLGDADRWTWVVEPGDPIWVVQGGGRVRTTLDDLNRGWAPGVRRDGAGQWEPVFWYSRSEPIGSAGSEPDLHVVYYDDPEAPYSRRGAIRNALSVLDYTNSDDPRIDMIRVFSQLPAAGPRTRLLDSAEPVARGVLDIRRHGGVDVVVTTSSFSRNRHRTRAGIYRLSYRVFRFLGEEELEDPPEGAEEGPGGRPMVPARTRAVMWTYDRMPTERQDERLVARTAAYPIGAGAETSLFNLNRGNQDKYSAFVVTNTDGDDAEHWELEDVRAYPDGDYLLRVTAESIGRSRGIGRAPTLRESDASLALRVTTNAAGTHRELRLIRP